MASITLKNIPPELLERLRERAERNRRSLMQEALLILEQGSRVVAEPWSGRAAESSPAYGADTTEHELRLETWRELCGQWESDESVDDEIEAIYAARTGGREVDL